MALTRQLVPDESAEPRIHCSCKTHHPRNSQLWVTGWMLLCETCRCGRGSRLGGNSDSLRRSCASFCERGIHFNANTRKIWWHIADTAHHISISYIFHLTHICMRISLFPLSLFFSALIFVFFFPFHSLCFSLACKYRTTCSLCSFQQHFETFERFMLTLVLNNWTGNIYTYSVSFLQHNSVSGFIFLYKYS